MKEIIEKSVLYLYTKYRLVTNRTLKAKTSIHPKIKTGQYVVLGKNIILNDELQIDTGTFIGDYTRIERCRYIGKYCSISHGVKIGLGSHPLTYVSTSPIFYSEFRGLVNSKQLSYDQEKDGYTVIENDVWIGANVLIMAGIKVGTGAVVAAGSVVTKDIPPYAVVAGIPAKILKYRFEEEIIQKLLVDQWWEKTPEYLKSINHSFSDVNKYLNSVEKRR